ncbi:MAG: hypothetical protein NC213_00380 [Acetobacter sp.]|nr:hypothetical protein [Bacteroides sp.]MCM1340182.1 hypothetical protein [Acetobacter sp.]MCM1432866.1 hypothetical protein [Clostridiales bacterium]
MNNCPKCNAKLKTFYFKPNCPYCNANIMHYNYDKRLAEDAALAEKEWRFVEDLINGIKQSSIGSAVSIIRLISFVLPIVALLMPVFKVDNQSITLISLIKNIVSDANAVFGSSTQIICLAAFASVVLFALISAVLSLFSFTKNGFKRNLIISVIATTVFSVISIAAAAGGCSVSYGVFAVVILNIITVILHFAQHK